MKNKKIKNNRRIAFFSIGQQVSGEDKKKKESLLWQEFCRNGGDPSAIPSFFNFGVDDGLVWCPTLEEFQKAVMNKSRNPVEYVKTY